MIRPEKLSAAWLKSETDSGSFSRGQSYFQQRRATLEHFGQPDENRLLLTGYCQGSEFHPYQQHVQIHASDEGPLLDGDCTCPVEYNCKHVVALVLTWQAQPKAVPRSEEKSDNLLNHWLRELTASHNPPEPLDDDALLYVLDESPNIRTGIRVDFAVARQRQDQGWNKGRRTVPSTLTNPWSRPRYLRLIDEDILRLLRSELDNVFGPGMHLTGKAGALALEQMVESGRAFWSDDRLGPLQRGVPRNLTLAWKKDEQEYALEISIDGGGRILPVDPAWYLDSDSFHCGPLELPDGLDRRRLELLLQAPPVPADQAEQLSRRLTLELPDLPTPVPVSITDINQPPKRVLTLEFDPRDPDRAFARLEFDYASHRLATSHVDSVVTGEINQQLVRIHRDAAAEKAAGEMLKKHGLESWPELPGAYMMAGQPEGLALRDAWFDWIDQSLPVLEAEGWLVELIGADNFNLSQSDGIDGEIETEGNDWFSLRFDLKFDGWVMPLVPLVSQLIDRYQPGELPDKLYLDTGEGHYVAVPAKQIEPVLKTILDLFDRIRDDRLELGRADAGVLLDLAGIPVQGGTSLHKLARQLRNFSGLKPVKLPTTFKGQLRDYQQHGVDWLQFLREQALGGILADDMGLGKTIQTLAHLAVEKRAGRLKDPVLIVAPTSLMSNWRREAERFTPGLSVLVLHGPDRADFFDQLHNYNLVLTTYPLLPRDRKVLLKQSWHAVILDEAQQIKNPRAQAAQIVRALKTRHRLCLTGTPMENHLGELWAQFDFLMPGFLGDREHFTRTYRTPIEKHQDGERLERLIQRTAPFMLRRTKDRVAAELPPKTELLRSTPIDERQARLYESIRLTMEKKVASAIAARGLARSHIIVLEALLKLRQVCCDPRLLPAGTPGVKNTPSAKMNLLFDLLPELLDEGRRILLFSQFTTMLGLIQNELDHRSIGYTKLTGQTRKREEAIDRFRSGQVNLFLISLKAGGVGLNLTEADTVIHYDPWWNPAVEHQASDRAHRIGQDKPVFIYKLITEGTVEEKIVALQARKHKLAESLYGKGKERNESAFDEATIEALLSAR